jgi:hypothetical protein
MENNIQTIRETIIIILALSAIHYFFRYFYHLSLWDVTRWWAFNFYKVDNLGAYAAGLFFCMLVYSMTFSGYINTVYLGLFGENQELVYLGHSKNNISVYYKRNDISKTLLSNYDVDITYNYSFDTLLRPQLFRKDRGTTNTVGTKANRFTLLSFIGITCAMISVLLATAIILHPFALKAYAASPTDITLPITNDPLTTFDHIIGQFHIKRGTYILLIFGFLFGFLGFVLAAPGQKHGARVEALPYSIKPGSVIHGVPNEIKPKYIKRRKATSKNSTDYETVDSGDRYVNFEFTEDFSRPVYVATLLHAGQRNELQSKVENNIKGKVPMRVIIGDDLDIDIYLGSL